MFSPMGNSNPQDLGNGGEIDGSLNITGDLTVSGGIGLTLSEVIQGTSTIDVTNAEALLIRKDGDSGDVFIVDTQNNDVTVGSSSLADGTLIIESNSSGDPKLKFVSTSNRIGIMDFVEGSSLQGSIVYNHNGDNLEFATGSTNRTARLVVNETSSYFTSNFGIGGTPSNQLTVVGDNAIKNINIYTNSDSAVTSDTGARIFTTGDGGSGIYAENGHLVIQGRPAGRDIIFLTNTDASEKMRLTSGGSLGIGTSSPAYTLAVEKSVTGDWLSRIYNTATSGNPSGLLVRVDDADSTGILFGANASGTYRFVVKPDGKVGIGTTSPSYKLDVDHGAVSSSDVTIARFMAESSRQLGLVWDDSASTLGLATLTSHSLVFHTGGNSNPRMVIDTSGNVGIGNSSPVAKVDIVGDRTINLTNTTSDDTNKNAVITHSQYDSGTETEGFLLMQGFSNSSTNRIDIGGGNSQHNATEEIKFHTASNSTTATGTERMVIDNSGNVGIGADPDGILFRAEKSVNGNWAGLIKNTHSTNGYGLKVQGGDDANVESFSVRDVSNTTLFNVLGSGNVGIGIDAPDTNLHIHKATAGTVDSNANAQLTIENNSHAGLQFLSPNDANNIIYFGDVNDNDISYIGYLHSTNDLQFYINGGVRLQLDANSRISLSNNDGGADNTVFGKLAGNALTTNGDENVLIGHEAGNDMNTGERNVCVGYQSGDKLTSGNRSVAIGYGSLGSEQAGARSIAVGFNALSQQNVGANTYNTAIGVEAGFHNRTGTNNTFVGYNAGLGASEQSNSNNVGIGSASLLSVTTGSHNVSIGKSSGDAVTDGAYNVFMGYYAGSSTTSATRSVAIGSEALEIGNHDQEGTVAIGSKALQRVTTGAGNTAIGYTSGADVTTGANNTLIGYNAGNTGSGDVTDGQANTIIGSGATANGSGAINRTAIGRTATAVADNSVTLGNASVTAVYMAQDSGATVHCGDILSGRASAGSTGNGHSIRSADSAIFSRDSSGETMQICRNASDGQFIQFRSDGNIKGDIRLDGETVSLTGFSGGHESSSSDSLEIGMVVSTIDEEHSKNHAKVEKSKTVGDKRVYGVVSNLEGLNGNNVTIASVGISSIKVTGSCEGGDLLESNGDGTAKVQSDDIIRSKTIGKVTMGNSTEEVKLVSCVLYCG